MEELLKEHALIKKDLSETLLELKRSLEKKEHIEKLDRIAHQLEELGKKNELFLEWCLNLTLETHRDLFKNYSNLTRFNGGNLTSAGPS